jgi:hypothetical protein
MATLEGRAAYLESKVEEHGKAFLAIDARFNAVDARFDRLDRRIDALDDKVSRQFIWTVGIQITTLIAIVGALLSRG